MKNRKIAIILPYFGRFNNYFNLFLESCRYNEEIDWIIFTDDKREFDYPSNVIVNYVTLTELAKRFESVFGYKIFLEKPYKLCDFRPLYGIIFEKELQGYDFWGWCDCDTIWGDILRLIPSYAWDEYDRIFDKGHLSFVRNSKEIKDCVHKYKKLKTILSGKSIYAFDEIYDGFYKGFSQILIENGYRVLNLRSIVADIDYRNKGFKIVEEEMADSVFCFNRGSLYKISFSGGMIVRTEIIYIHLQKRKMLNNVTNTDEFYIVPNAFLQSIDEVTENYIVDLNKDEEEYFDPKEDTKFYRSLRLKRMIHEPNKVSLFMYKLKSIKLKP